MTSIEIARRFVELQQIDRAQAAYILALGQEKLSPEEELEASSFLFFSESDHKLPFTHFVELFNRGYFQKEILELMTQAFYLPNLKKQEKQYDKNVKALSSYPYLFRKDFPKFEELPVLFFPFDNNGFVPYFTEENRFGDYVNFNDPIIDRYFFKDLSKPILASDVYSQYQLEYLNDNVRKSEWVAKENHIYLHYKDWKQFCSYLSVLNFKSLLPEKKIVLLIDDEINRYPIDFKNEYGIDYSQFDVKPIGVHEVNKIIWHTQLATHNGGDFFNEIFYEHPNLIVFESVMLDSMQDLIKKVRELLEMAAHMSIEERCTKFPGSVRALYGIKNPTDKDILVSLYLNNLIQVSHSNPSERIAPALFFQPHFKNIVYRVDMPDESRSEVTLYSEQYQNLKKSEIFKNFKYIKTFTPMRRPTTSYGATVKFVVDNPTETEDEKANKHFTVEDMVTERLLNRSFMVNDCDRLYHDSRLVRFEDGKLNPKATFTALAEFLDIPYTESMTFCSSKDGINPESLKGNDLGFSSAAIYRTYDEYANDSERAFIEYFFRDAYQTYGYDFHYYKGEPVDETWVRQKSSEFNKIESIICKSWDNQIRYVFKEAERQNIMLASETQENKERAIQNRIQEVLEKMRDMRIRYALAQLKGLRFVNKEGQPLRMMTPLKLDPDLLEQPLYH